MIDKLTTLLKFQEIFELKSWTLMDGCDDKLNRFGDLIDNLKQDEINLLLELTHMYEWMSYNDYHNNLRRLLKTALEEQFKDKNQLIFFPIIKPTDEGEVKSGHVVMKMLEGIKPSINGFKNLSVNLLKEFRDLKSEKLTMTDNDFLILVDDYIGSGKTLNKALSAVAHNESITHQNFGILTMAIQEQAKVELDEQGIINYNSLILKKGISDNYVTPDLETKIEIMKRIENKIPKVSKYRMGYEKSEALITLMRTPNNTFPVFWKGIISKGEEIEAPFQRY
ncbi:hypothetical protein SAMN05421766_10267 [Zobellia uliginosa]|uniref:PRTase-CE domain-containing protein n=1 Tax=Zobellia uliginosa TaxID=143224 RepID=A0ABY1KL29_9FLAO|nr:hypothetical protein [Zobellia uliginosa]SIS46894.1 hypothetical protein SAMN05421766_10267 [Zobellia uliginosa]